MSLEAFGYCTGLTVFHVYIDASFTFCQNFIVLFFQKGVKIYFL